MKKTIKPKSLLMAAVVFTSSVLGEDAPKPILFIGEVNKIRVLFMIRTEESFQSMRKLPGTTMVNFEPECIMVETYLEYLDKNRIKINLPLEGYYTQRTKELLGLEDSTFIVEYQPSTKPNTGSKILSIKPDKKKANKSEMATPRKPSD